MVPANYKMVAHYFQLYPLIGGCFMLDFTTNFRNFGGHDSVRIVAQYYLISSKTGRIKLFTITNNHFNFCRGI